MRSTRVLIFFVVALLASLFVSAAKGSDLEVSAGVEYANRYVWRGQLGTDDSVLQRGVNVQYDNINFNVFLNMDVSGGEFGKIDEVNYDLSYSDFLSGIATQNLAYTIGAVHYDYPTTDIPETTEVYAGIGVATLLYPSLTAYYDVGEADGLYVQAGVGERVMLFGNVVDLTAKLGWGNNQYNQYYWGDNANRGSDSGSFQDLVLRASTPLQITENLSIEPAITYTQLLDRELREFNTYSDSSCHLVASVSVLFSF